MNKVQIKEEIHKYINQADDRFIHLVYGMIKEDKNEIVAHTVKGKPLTQSEYVVMIEESEDDIKAGRVISHKKLKKEIKGW